MKLHCKAWQALPFKVTCGGMRRLNHVDILESMCATKITAALIFGLALTGVFDAQQVFSADEEIEGAVRCTTKVHYSWMPKESEQEQKEHWTTLWLDGESQKKATAELEKLADRITSEAQEHCRKRHENLSGCIAAKYSSLGPTLKALDYSARTSLEKAIVADCESVNGACKSPGYDPVTCTAAKSAEEEDDKDGEGEEAAEGTETDKVAE